MIIVRFTSGLGNQMFQYSFYRFLKTLYKDTEVKADLTWFYANNDHHGYELQRIFGSNPYSPFEVEEATKREIFRVTGVIPNLFKPRSMITGGNIRSALDSGSLSFEPGSGVGSGRYSDFTSRAFEKIRRYPNRVIREFTRKKREPYIIDQLGGQINNEDNYDGSNDLYDKVTSLDVSKDWYIIGFWIEEKYLNGRLDEMRQHFRFPAITDEINGKLEKEITSSNSVSLHIRRGDYISETYEDMFEALGRDYYEGAVNYIKERVEDPKFFIFSDDSDFVRREFEWLDNKQIVTGNDGDLSFRDMQLMSMCKHNIIANSTFSQWAALLNDKEGHMTLYPSTYLKDSENEMKYFDGWIMI
ncbi:MAG: alpha-1,2-fucosyltransferase [Lachnospiraceae bacterium]|nr:alpha-1,2-fucosyltransferase [Lachnospiraceae bacterium]